MNLARNGSGKNHSERTLLRQAHDEQFLSPVSAKGGAVGRVLEFVLDLPNRFR